MAPSTTLRTRLSMFAVAIILLACSAIGMFTGVFAHTLASPRTEATATFAPVISGTLPVAAATATPALTATETSAPSSTATGFALSITLSAHTLSAGDTFTVTVVATAHGAPVAGLPCVLRSPVSGPPGLFSTWPAAASTDASGSVSWSLAAPAAAPGAYGIEVSAVGSHHYEFHRYVTVTLT